MGTGVRKAGACPPGEPDRSQVWPQIFDKVGIAGELIPRLINRGPIEALKSDPTQGQLTFNS
ncbi:MAG: hypothetical protein ACM3S5_16895, partial [Rhodospirillales bacterium]